MLLSRIALSSSASSTVILLPRLMRAALAELAAYGACRPRARSGEGEIYARL